MALITDATIRRLAGFKGNEHPVVSLYLDVDGRRWPRYQDCESRVEMLVRDALERGNGHHPVAADLERVESYVKGGLDRSNTRGLAIFASGDALWEVFQLAVPVRDQIVVNETPHVRQLEAVLDKYEAFGVLLVDRQRARMFVFELGELVDRSELFEQLPRHDDDGGDWDKDHVRDHAATLARQHLKHAARVAFEVFQNHPFEHLILAVSDDIAGELERFLHSYLRERIAARVHIPASASEAEIRSAALEVEEDVERQKEQELVDRIRAAVGAGQGGVAGLADVLAAVADRRVDTLLVSEGYAPEGWQCKGCGFLAPLGPNCARCDEAMRRVDDVVELAIEDAVLNAARVRVCAANADLDVMGRVAAHLRF